MSESFLGQKLRIFFSVGINQDCGTAIGDYCVSPYCSAPKDGVQITEAHILSPNP